MNDAPAARLVPMDRTSLPALLTDDPLFEIAAQAGKYIKAAKAASTLRAYASDWAHFEAWCLDNGQSALPATPSTVALYLTVFAPSLNARTLTRRLTSISARHRKLGYPSPATMEEPVVGEVLKGIRRSHPARVKSKRPLLTADIVKVVESLEGVLVAARDHALLLVGFVGGFRRSELAALTVEDLRHEQNGSITVLLRKSKTDQEGHGREVEISRGQMLDTCPVRALRTWLEISSIQKGPIFRAIDRHGRIAKRGLHPDSIGRLVQRLVSRSGYQSSLYGGHSLRSGFATQAYLAGASELDIMQQTGHRSLATLRKYIREDQRMRQRAVSKLGI